MKRNFILIAVICCMSVYACTDQSSPEGRSKIRDAGLKAQIDSLEIQVRTLQQRVDAMEMK